MTSGKNKIWCEKFESAKKDEKRRAQKRESDNRRSKSTQISIQYIKSRETRRTNGLSKRTVTNLRIIYKLTREGVARTCDRQSRQDTEDSQTTLRRETPSAGLLGSGFLVNVQRTGEKRLPRTTN